MTAIEKLSPEEEAYYLSLAEKFDKAKKEGTLLMFDKSSKLDPEMIHISAHAFTMANERFRIRNRCEATEFLRGLLHQSTYICETVDEVGNRTHLYGANFGKGVTVELHICLEYKILITVIKHTPVNYPMPSHMKEKVFKMFRTELRKLFKDEKKVLDSMAYTQAEANAEIYPLRFELMKTNSQSKIETINERLAEIEEHLKNKNSEVAEVQKQIRLTARSMVTLL